MIVSLLDGFAYTPSSFTSRAFNVLILDLT